AQSHQEYRRIIVSLLDDLAERAGLRWDADVVLVAEQAMTLMFGAALGWFELRDDALFRAVLDDAAGMVGRRLVCVAWTAQLSAPSLAGLSSSRNACSVVSCPGADCLRGSERLRSVRTSLSGCPPSPGSQ